MAPKFAYGRCAIVTLVLLRLAIGWHFFSEGSQKLKGDSFTSVHFLKQATGPLAPLYHAQVPSFHQWDDLFAVPRPTGAPSEEATQEVADWSEAYQKRKKEAEEAEKPTPLEITPAKPYGKFANQLFADWEQNHEDFTSALVFNEEQNAAALQSLVDHRQLALDYLAENEADITKYQHELARLEAWEEEATAGGLAFHDTRIAAKRAELNGMSRPWQSTLNDYERSFLGELRAVIPKAQRDDPQIALQVNKALNDVKAARLETIDRIISYVICGVGVALVVGFFTPLAGFVGAIFLLSVMASQPPWVSGAETTYFYYQLAECLALMTLACTCAGRWAGIDFIFARGCCCGPK